MAVLTGLILGDFLTAALEAAFTGIFLVAINIAISIIFLDLKED
jgi:hypothetical protein